ncbi:nitrate reductase molybdenum cofactor assembly chaperone [Bordetella petrii]|uniref:nitrate reductase molybdenum cofactor assembly chaperone n=1 Tax=Bordetella petrii TaxID=94624 RepID=UPI001E45BFF9|nr:nitrate reductase molybdenum cofactor assembly chaperone [Bordetella petrii]MCD0503882.1 nitrate reductase molybdenum cofactor assembly chaperone [Bordetella petrii]
MTIQPLEPPAVSVYSVLSALLAYPDDALLGALPELQAALDAPQRAQLAPVFAALGGGQDLIDLQEQYVATFDRRPAHSLHLFEHIHGESRDRGQAMVDLREEYLRHGLLLDTSELPDYVPLFLEFLGQIPPADSAALLGDAIHVLARIGDKLAQSGSAYACVFTVLRAQTDTVPQPLPEPPEGDMEEAMVTFGPEADGTEPVMRARGQTAQPVRFYEADPRQTAAAPGGGQR